jgi:hypothetical protein
MSRPFAFLFASLLLAMHPAVADQELSALALPEAAKPDAAGGSEESVYSVHAPPVVIEGELPHLEPTPEELLQRFRDSLAAPPSYLSSEKRLADGTVEASTRLGRLCSHPVPVQSVSGVGGDVRLIVPCASF